jgi:hypothetical protein
MNTDSVTYYSIGGGFDSTEQLDAPGRIEEAASRHRPVGEQDPDLRHSEEANTRSPVNLLSVLWKQIFLEIFFEHTFVIKKQFYMIGRLNVYVIFRLWLCR